MRKTLITSLCLALIISATLLATPNASASLPAINRTIDHWDMQAVATETIAIGGFPNFTISINWGTVITTNTTDANNYYFQFEDTGGAGYAYQIQIPNDALIDHYVLLWTVSGSSLGGLLYAYHTNKSYTTLTYDATTIKLYDGATQVYQYADSFLLDSALYYSTANDATGTTPSFFNGNWRLTISNSVTVSLFDLSSLITIVIVMAVIGMLTTTLTFKKRR